MGVSIAQHQPGSFTVEMSEDGGSRVPSSSWSQEFLLISDAHIDNAHADRQMFERHMRQCRERGAKWISNGDFLCLMQGKWDMRSDTSACRPEHREGRYLDSVINTTADYVAPHADMALLFAPGNHETAVKKRHETDMNERLVEALKVRNKNCTAHAGELRELGAVRRAEQGAPAARLERRPDVHAPRLRRRRPGHSRHDPDLAHGGLPS
jgi:hypothetical protein